MTGSSGSWDRYLSSCFLNDVTEQFDRFLKSFGIELNNIAPCVARKLWRMFWSEAGAVETFDFIKHSLPNLFFLRSKFCSVSIFPNRSCVGDLLFFWWKSTVPFLSSEYHLLARDSIAESNILILEVPGISIESTLGQVGGIWKYVVSMRIFASHYEWFHWYESWIYRHLSW